MHLQMVQHVGEEQVPTLPAGHRVVVQVVVVVVVVFVIVVQVIVIAVRGRKNQILSVGNHSYVCKL